MRAAGIPGIRYDLLYPNVPEGGCLADLENLGDETTAEGIVSPSVNTNYGLSYKDFFMVNIMFHAVLVFILNSAQDCSNYKNNIRKYWLRIS